MDDQTNTRLTRLAFGLLLAPAFIGLVVASAVAFHRGDWPMGVVLVAMFPMAILM